MRRLISLALLIAVLGCGSSSAPSSRQPAGDCDRGLPRAGRQPRGPVALCRRLTGSCRGLAVRSRWPRSRDGGAPSGPLPWHAESRVRTRDRRPAGQRRHRSPTTSCSSVPFAPSHSSAPRGRDAHTGLFPWSPASTYPVDSLPLRLWLFPDGIHVVAALPPYEDLVGSTVEIVGRAPGRRRRRGHRPAGPAGQRADRPAPDAALPADAAGAPRSRTGRWRRAGRARASSSAERRAADRAVEPDPHGRLQRLGRAVRPLPAGRSERALPVADGGSRCGGPSR